MNPINNSAGVESLSPLGLYIHIPFCERKCPYCDFNTYAGLESHFGDLVDALIGELARWESTLRERPPVTLFIGGGTPTVLDDALLVRLFEALRRYAGLDETVEITCEANPGTVDRSKFRLLRSLGVNRLSLGVQSFQPEELEFLGRIHGVDDVYRAVEAARAAGFDNINLDFMFGLPNQRPEVWAATLEKALGLTPEHLSLYSLIVEPNTPLHHWVETGRAPAPDEDVAAELYEISIGTLAAAGYIQYEVSNWAKRTAHDAALGAALEANLTGGTWTPERAGRHNLLYWRNQEYLGIGPGAHSHLRLDAGTQQQRSRRWGNRKPVPGYIKRIARGDSVEDFHEELSPAVSMGETMLLGLRLVREGVPHERFARLHGLDLRRVFEQELAQLEAWGLVTVDAERVRLTRAGLMVGNQVFARFVETPEPA